MNMINSCNVNTATLTKHTSKSPFTVTLNWSPPSIGNTTQENTGGLGNLTTGNISSTIYGADYDETEFASIHGWLLWLTWGPLAMI